MLPVTDVARIRTAEQLVRSDRARVRAWRIMGTGFLIAMSVSLPGRTYQSSSLGVIHAAGFMFAAVQSVTGSSAAGRHQRALDRLPPVASSSVSVEEERLAVSLSPVFRAGVPGLAVSFSF